MSSEQTKCSLNSSKLSLQTIHLHLDNFEFSFNANFMSLETFVSLLIAGKEKSSKNYFCNHYVNNNHFQVFFFEDKALLSFATFR
jgi:hypothetical protein